MKLVRSFVNDGNIYPSLFNLLTAIKENDKILHHSEHMQMHPIAIYNKSMTRIFTSINDLIDYMQNQHETKKYSNSNELFVKTKEVIESIIAFKDDTFQIMKCLYPKSAFNGKKEERFADRWLETVNKNIIEDFKNNIRFLDNINKINNKIKHNNGRLSFFQIKAMNYFNVMGFFLDAVDEKGTKIPDENVHPKFKGMHTGYSYNYLIPLVFTYTYFLSEYACLSINAIIKDTYGEVVAINRIEDESTSIINIINKINKFTTKIVFPDEYKRDFPEVMIVNDELIIKYPTDDVYMRKFLKYNSHIINLITGGDGFTKAYQLPYWFTR